MKKTEVESVEISNRVFYRNSYVKSVDLANVHLLTMTCLLRLIIAEI